MTTTLGSDGLWDMIEPLLPLPKPKPQGGRPYTRSSVPEGYCFCPAQWYSLGDVAKGTGLRLGHDLLETPARLARVWYLAIDSLCAIGLAWPRQSDRLVPSRRGQLLGSSGFWGQQTGPNPTDRAKLGSKRHLICDGRGVPLAILLTGANQNDSQQTLALVDALPVLQGKCGRPRHRPDCGSSARLGAE